MISPQTRLQVAVVPISRILIHEAQPRYPERVAHYVQLLSDPAHAGEYAGVVALAPVRTRTGDGRPLYVLLDGHHRYVASVITGRRELLALIHYEPGDPGYESAVPVQTTAQTTLEEVRAS